MDVLSVVLAYGWQHPLKVAAYALLAPLPLLGLYFTLQTLIRPRRSSLRDLPGPPPDSFFFGNMARILAEEPGECHIRWMKQYGGALKYSDYAGDQRLLVSDPTALNHILLSNAYDYPKPDDVRGQLATILGEGVLFAEGEDHRRQRRILQPAFGAGHLRETLPLFFEHSYKLRDVWKDLVTTDAVDETAWKNPDAAQAYKAERPEGETVLEVCNWLNRLTLDIIGLAGFGYAFRELDQEKTPLGTAFTTMFSPRRAGKVMTISKDLTIRAINVTSQAVPLLSVASWIPHPRFKGIREGFRILQEESLKIIESKQGEVEKHGLESLRGSKDLIALLLKSMGSGAKSAMTTAELRGQLTTFLLAGHETSSTSLGWAMLALSRLPEKQKRLREELHAARAKAFSEGREELDLHELDSLPYLDAVIRETLRIDSPLPATIRRAAHDDLIPLSSPMPSTLDPSKTISHITVKAGQVIMIPLCAVNKNSDIFGEDADTFRPERWLDSEDGTGKKIEGNVGTYSNILTFLAGPRSCIGYRFALARPFLSRHACLFLLFPDPSRPLELKAILSVLFDDFEFSPRDDDIKIRRQARLMTRPVVAGEETLGSRLPLRVRLAKRED
ncbi:hypothetical protein JCM11641_004166 [Rhodosporidiobolus odoratus]